MLFFVLASSRLSALDFYVSLTGDDSNPGTIDHPWRNLSKAADTVNPGDTVNLRAGVYMLSENVTLYRSGASSARITVRANAGESVVLDGSSAQPNTVLLNLTGNFITVSNFEIRNASAAGISNYGGANNVIQNNVIHDCFGSGIFVGHANFGQAHDVVVDGNVVYHNVHLNDPHTLSSGWSGAVSAGGAVGIVFTNNIIYENQGEGLIFYLSNSCRAAGNVIHDNFGSNLYMDNARSCTVDGNLIYGGGATAYWRSGNSATGILNANEQYPIDNSLSDNTIVNNLLINNLYGFYYGNFGKGGGLKNFLFANNTLYGAVQELIIIDPDAHSNAAFSNNICVQINGAPMLKLPQSLAGLAFNHNLWFGGSPGAASGAGDINADPQFKSAGSINAADYVLLASSPARGAAVSLAAVKLDYFGVSRVAPADLGAIAFYATVAPPPPPVNRPPVILSSPSVAPNPAFAGQTLSFSVSGFDYRNNPITYTWNYGDGTSAQGATTFKSYSAPGTFTITVTLSAGALSTSQSFQLTVDAANQGISILKAVVTFNFKTSGRDSLILGGTLLLPAGFSPDGTAVSLKAGNYTYQSTLNSRGAAGDRIFKLSGFKAGNTSASFTFALRRADLFGELKSLGFNNTPGSSYVPFPLAVTLSQSSYFAQTPLNYLVKAVKGSPSLGTAKP
jgi:hypothetical protein